MRDRIQNHNNAPRIHLNTNLQGLSTSTTIAIQQLSRKLTGEGREIYRLGLGQSPFPVTDSVVEYLQNYCGRTLTAVEKIVAWLAK